MSEEVVRVLPQDLTGIVIEITENELLFGGERLSREIAELRGRGARIAIDDAGAGYAGLKHLMLPPARHRQARPRARRGHQRDAAKQALIDAFVRFAREIGAESAPRASRARRPRVLADLDVAIGQGYVVGRPAEQFTEPQEGPSRRCATRPPPPSASARARPRGRHSSPTGISSSPPSASAP